MFPKIEEMLKSFRKTVEVMAGPLTTPISVRIEERQLDYLKSVARKMAAAEDKDISYVDLIRHAIKETYPVPEDGP